MSSGGHGQPVSAGSSNFRQRVADAEAAETLVEHQHRIRQEIEQLFVSWDRYPELYDAVAEGQPLQPDDHVMVQRVLDFFDAAGTDADLKTALIFLARNHWNVGHATNLYFAEVYGQPVRDTAGIESSLSDDRLAEGNDVDAPLFCGEVVARAGDETHGFNAVTVVEGETVMEEGVQVPIESVSKRKGTKKGATAQWLSSRTLARQAEMRRINPDVNRNPTTEYQLPDDSLRQITLNFPTGESRTNTWPNPLDWEDNSCRTRLNRWRQQHFRRHFGPKQEFRKEYHEEEDRWLIAYFKAFRERWLRTQPQRAVDWRSLDDARLEREFNGRFQGRRLNGETEPRALRSRSSLLSQRNRLSKITAMTGFKPKKPTPIYKKAKLEAESIEKDLEQNSTTIAATVDTTRKERGRKRKVTAEEEEEREEGRDESANSSKKNDDN